MRNPITAMRDRLAARKSEHGHRSAQSTFVQKAKQAAIGHVPTAAGAKPNRAARRHPNYGLSKHSTPIGETGRYHSTTRVNTSPRHRKPKMTAHVKRLRTDERRAYRLVWLAEHAAWIARTTTKAAAHEYDPLSKRSALAHQRARHGVAAPWS